MPKKAEKELPNTQVRPEPSLEARRRREHSPEYKIRIVAEAEACKHGELGGLLRREGLYSGQIRQWRKDLKGGNTAKLAKSIPGPTARVSAEQREIEQLNKKVKHLERELKISNGCLDLQKKALEILDLQNSGSEQ